MGTVPKTVIHIFHADPDSLTTGAHVAERVRQVAADRGIQLQFARDAFARYGQEAAAVISFCPPHPPPYEPTAAPTHRRGRRGGVTANCYDCARAGRTVPATAVCRHRGAAVCAEHAHATAELVTRSAGMGLSTLPPPARRITCTTCTTCTTCYDAEHSGKPAPAAVPRRPLADLIGDRK